MNVLIYQNLKEVIILNIFEKLKSYSIKELEEELIYYEIGCDKKECIDPNYCNRCKYIQTKIKEEINKR